MDKLKHYQDLIKRILSEYVELSNRKPNANIEKFLVTDDEHGHYIWLKLGWERGKRVKYITVYVRIHEGKFWIEEDLTEEGIAADLIRAVVPKEDIVLAFHEPSMRQYTAIRCGLV